MKRQRVLTWVLVWVLLVAGTPAVFAAAVGERIPWQVEDFGTFYVPSNWQATKINLPKDFLNGKKTEDILKATADMPNSQAKLANRSVPPSIQAYQVTLNDGTAYHLAWLVFLQDVNKMDPEARKFFSEEITDEQKAQARRFVSIMNNAPQKSFDDPQTNMGVTLIEMLPVEFLKMNKKQAFAGAGRILFKADGMVFPLYGKGYVFNTKGYMSFAMLVTVDGERTFWEPVLRNVMTSLNRR